MVLVGRKVGATTRGGAITAPRPPGPPFPTGDAGFLLARAGGRAIRALNRALQPHGLRSRHYTALGVAADGGGRSQRELGELLDIDPSAVVALVDDLERAGLVRRDPHPDDRRTRLIVATAEGRARLREAAEPAAAVDDLLLADLDPAERATLVRLLARIS
jgi:DNA-binding MarR family transcriptional regulator